MEIFVVFRQEKLNKDQHHKKMSGNGNVVVTAVGSSADPERLLLHVLKNWQDVQIVDAMDEDAAVDTAAHQELHWDDDDLMLARLAVDDDSVLAVDDDSVAVRG